MTFPDKATAPGGRSAAAPDAAPGSQDKAHDAVVVLSNAPDMLLAKRIAHALVEESLVACASLGSPCLSMYMWEGTLQGADEIPIMLKTTRARVPQVVERLQRLHPDAVPEILVVPVLGGSESYLSWVGEQTAAPKAAGG